MSKERFNSILERQRHYRVLDIVAAAVLAIGIALAAVMAVSQLPGLEPLYPSQRGEVGPDTRNPAEYTAAMMAEAEATPQTVRVLAR